MIAALLIGREGSKGFPGKNWYPVLGKPLMAYPLEAASNAKGVDRLFVSSDSEKILKIAAGRGAEPIVRPPELAADSALGEEVFRHGYREICGRLASRGDKPELLVLLFCNAPTVTSRLIEEGIRVLREDPSIDSAVSVSAYNMWSPLRARRLGPEGFLQPFVPFEAIGNPQSLNCDRDSQGEVYFADMGVSVVRPRCLDNLEDGLLPQRWMGRKIHPLKQWGGLDVDYQWQIPQVEFWLKAHGADV
ncbi:MAG: cytidylyltransferase [Candidatus Omnitrophica bacterium]|nr:cytidylyltransferase [Candidatus Omnitrophota bacterium]